MNATNKGIAGAGGLMEFKPLVFGYSNARVRAMRTALLTRRQAEDMLRVKTNAAVSEYLARTTYRDDFSKMPMKITDEERVEIAVSRNFARAARTILRITPAQGRHTVQAFLSRYDIHNLKSVLLARKLGKSKEDAQLLMVPAGSLSHADIERMLSAKSSDELYESIRATDFGARFLSSASTRHIPRAQVKATLQNPHSESARLDLLISALESYYYEVASSASSGSDKDSQLLLSLVKSEADAKNTLTIMRMKRGGADKKATKASLVQGGSFLQNRLDAMMAAKDFSEVARLASGFFLSETGRSEFSAAERRYKEDGQLSHFEVVFENSIARRSLKALHRSTMSIAALVGFLFLKEEEMNNIRKIVRGKALGIPAEKISEMLILVGNA